MTGRSDATTADPAGAPPTPVPAKLRRGRRAFAAAALLALLTGVALLWLLHTTSGRDFALRRLAASLPDGGTLTWRAAQGTLAGPLVLDGLRLSLPVPRDDQCQPRPAAPCATGTLRLGAAQVRLDPALWPLLARRLRLDTLVVNDAQLDLPRDDTPFALPQWPELLPTIDIPLTIETDALALDAIAIHREGEPLATLHQVRGGVRVGAGRLQLRQLRVDSTLGAFTAQGDYAPRDNYRTRLTASAVFPAVVGQPAATLALSVRGDLNQLEATAEGQLPGATRLQLTLAGAGAAPHWQLLARSARLDPGLFDGHPGTTPLQFHLEGSGEGGAATLRGALTRDGFTATVQPSKLRIQGQRLELRPLVVDLLAGRVTANGHLDFARSDPARSNPGHADQASVDLALGARGLRWEGATSATAIAADADLRLAGQLDRWTLRGQATLARGNDRAQVTLQGEGDRNSASVTRFAAGTRAGRLEAKGQIAWAPALRWQADASLVDFDPGYFAPDWPGALRGQLHSTGAQDGQRLTARLDVRALAGQLRQRPLSGHAQLAIDGPSYQGELALTLGGSRIEAKGRSDTVLAVDGRLDPLQLDDLLPGARGRLQGQFQLRGQPKAPDVAAELSGTGVAYGDLRAARLAVHGRLPWQQGSGALDIDASGLQLGVPLDNLRASLRGALTQLQLEANAQGPDGRLALNASARQQGSRWLGRITQLTLAPRQAGSWTLQGPTDWGWDGHSATLANACLQADAGGSLCARGGWPRPGITLQASALPLALLSELLPKREDGRPWVLVGSVDLDATLATGGGGWTAQAQLRSASGGLRERQRARRDLFGYRDLHLTVRANPQRVEAGLNAALSGNGRIDATLHGGWTDAAPLSGRIQAQTRALAWLELLSPDLVAPAGQLAIDLRLDGSRNRLRLGGSARLQDLRAELPALGVGIESGNIALEAREDGSAQIQGTLGTGQGDLRIDGSLGWQGDDTPLQLAIRGREVLLADTRQLRLQASPDLRVTWAAGAPVQLRGEVAIPSADIHLEKLELGVSASPDVVVLDPIRPPDGAPLRVDLDLNLHVGDRVRVDGYGLEGALSGALRVRQPPGGETRATGTLEVGGRYRAYGQNLQITRGNMLWSNGAIGDPQLDIRAERHVDAVVAGVAVRGRASSPQASVFSDPAMSQSEAIAYLTLGRPLASLTGREAQQVGMARSALNAGAGLLAAELGARIGLDDAGVSSSRALGGEVLGVGKYLSPRLYVSYGVSLLGTGQVVTLKYLLKKGFDLQIESSTVQNRASINWRTEK